MTEERLRKGQVVEAILNFDWGNYGLDAVQEAVDSGLEDDSCNQWARHLAAAVLDAQGLTGTANSKTT